MKKVKVKLNQKEFEALYNIFTINYNKFKPLVLPKYLDIMCHACLSEFYLLLHKKMLLRHSDVTLSISIAHACAIAEAGSTGLIMHSNEFEMVTLRRMIDEIQKVVL